MVEYNEKRHDAKVAIYRARGGRLKSEEEKIGTRAVGPSSRGRRSHLRARKRFPLSMGYNGVISR